MSTRSYIMIEENDGNFKGIYCHSDGYLTYNGAMLIDHYNTREKVEKLMSLGNLSTLCERMDPDPRFPHSFEYNKRQDGVCVAYSRDRGETNQEAQVVPLSRLSDDPWIEYVYVFTKDDKWKYFEGSSYSSYSDLRDVKEDLDEWFKGKGIERPEGLYGYYDEKAIEIIKREQEKQKSRMLSARDSKDKEELDKEKQKT